MNDDFFHLKDYSDENHRDKFDRYDHNIDD